MSGASVAAPSAEEVDAAILERAKSLSNRACFAIALQRRRLRSAEPEAETFLFHWWADLEKYPTAYLDGGGLRRDPRGPLFRTIGRGTGLLIRTVLPQANAYAMIGRRTKAAGIATKLGNHSFRATGITA